MKLIISSAVPQITNGYRETSRAVPTRAGGDCTITLRHNHTRQDYSGRVISPTKRPLPDNTQHSQEKDIHGHGGIRTHNSSKRAAGDPRLKGPIHPKLTV